MNDLRFTRRAAFLRPALLYNQSMAARSAKPAPEPGARRWARPASGLFAATVLLALALGAGYLKLTGRLDPVVQGAAISYRNWIEDFVNDPNNESYRAEVLARVIDAYRDLPAGKSLGLRNDAGQVIGRFRISVATISQPQADSNSPAQRRRYRVALTGNGELWHDTGGRVRFTGSATVDYDVDFKVDDWTVFAWFTCADVTDAQFECSQIDNLLGQLMPGIVRRAGRAALEESLRPGFTLILKPNGDAWLTKGHVGHEYQPRKGPMPETDGDFETLWNDTTRLERGFRDYLGPIELHPGDELRVTAQAVALDPRENFGVDVLCISAADFAAYEERYPNQLDKPLTLAPVEGGYNVQRQSFEVKDRPGTYFLLLDYTEFGLSHEHWKQQTKPGLVEYYVRIKR